ncbi:S8 family serine peptidase [Emticicia sp. 21SJ11W-3]|uniref:S8 family serine peptidase n=1 Tax=Emticicia sp. 21SJ11W-3 TaxID=2916755 RepID=UPI00209F8F2A|nr:S8 family serine peptidase [Emticicia sp. 21SJ11W-3]UTA66479.1 S8 family peptidase [Emticicia sp. 21SJ11W-3]
MKTLFLALLFISFASMGQKNSAFYYYFDQKISIQKDSSAVLLIGSSAEEAGQVGKFLAESKISYSLQSPYKHIVKVPSRSLPVNKTNFNRALKEKYPKVYISYAYTYEGSELFALNEILIKPKVALSEIEKRFSNNIRIKKVKKYNTAVLEVLADKDVLEVANQIYESGLTEWCQPNFIAERKLGNTLYPDQYYLHNTGQFGGTAGIDINAPEAWALTAGCGVRVAVVDQGVNNHDDMDGRVAAGFDPGNTTNPGAPLVADDNHGVACAGIIAASNNTIGIRGIASNAIIVPAKIFNGNTAYSDGDIADAIDWAWDEGNAAILSNSWGGGSPSTNITNAINNATTLGRGSLGAVVVFSAGNGYPTYTDVAYPASLSNVLAVGAVDKNGSIWGYSQRGSALDIVAPSGDVNLNGDVRTTDRMGSAGYSSGDYANNFGGTSAAAPQASGVAALILSVNPGLSQAQVRTIIQQTATDMGSSGFDNTFGNGRLNAQAAVIAAVGGPITGPDLVCTNGSFSLTGTAPGSVTWSSGNTSILTINSSTGYATRVGNGVVTITATISTSCGNVQITKTTFAGNPDLTKKVNGVVAGTVEVFGGNTYSLLASSNSPGTSFNYNDYTGSGTISLTIYNPSSASTNMYVSSTSTNGNRFVKVTATNTCGSYNEDLVFYVRPSFRLAYPNPAKGQLTLEFNGVDETLPDAIELINEKSGRKEMALTKDAIMRDIHKQQDNKYTIDVSKLERGTWYMRVVKKGAKAEVIRLILD